MTKLVVYILKALGIDISTDYDTGSLIARFAVVFIILSVVVFFLAVQVEEVYKRRAEEIGRHEVPVAKSSNWGWRILAFLVFVALLWGSLKIAVLLE